MGSRIQFVMLLCVLFSVQGLQAADKPLAKAPKQVKKTIITGEQFIFNPLKNMAFYEGDVVVIDPQMDLLCDKLTIFFAPKKKDSKPLASSKSTPKNEENPSKPNSAGSKDPMLAPMVGLGGNIDKIIAEGDVEIINKKDKTRAVGGYAVYTAKTEVLVLTNNPKLFTKRGILLGRLIEYNRKTGELLAKQAVLENREELKPKAPLKKPNGK